MIIDVHSYYTDSHPVNRPGAKYYLIAPPPGDVSKGLRAFRLAMGQLEGARAVGGLLPVQGTEDRAYKKALSQPWWVGLLLSPAYSHGQKLSHATVSRRINHPRALNIPLIIECGHAGYSRPEELESFLEKLPHRPVVLTHGGQLNISGSHLSQASKIFDHFPHTYLETSGIYRQDFLEEMFHQLGPERILYGSGFPWMDERLEAERVRILPAGEGALKAIFSGNARELFKLESLLPEGAE